MSGRTVHDAVATPETYRRRPAIAVSRRALCWGSAIILALIVLSLLPRYSPSPSVTYTAANLATKRDATGFYPPEIDGSGNHFVWAQPNAVVGFDFASRKPLTITAELRAAATVGGPDTPVGLLVNGRELASVHLDPQQRNFQPYRFRVPSASGPLVEVGLASKRFGPRPNDGRRLGVMVRAITIDRADAWSTITRRAWLYWLVPLCAILIAAGASLARQAKYSTIGSFAGYGAVGAAAGGTGAMLIATVLLLSIGELDRSTYYLWLFGTAYLAILGATVALALPFGAAASSSLGWRITHWPALRRHIDQLQTTGRVALFTATLLFACGFFTYYGTGDVDRKLRWIGNTRAYGLIEAYRGILDQYPPLTLTLLDAMRYIGSALHFTDFDAFKLSLTVLFALTGAAFLWWRRDLLLTAGLLLALLPNTLALGYTDIYFAPTLLLMLAALQRRRFVAFSLLLAVTCLIKWQAAIIAPPLLIAALRLAMTAPREGEARPRMRLSLARLAAIVLPGLGVTIGVLAVFGKAVFTSLQHGFDERFLSANALNAPWLLTQVLHLAAPQTYGSVIHTTIQTADLHITLGPKLAFAAAYLFALVALWRAAPTFVDALRWSLAAYLAYFAFNTGVHENHLFTAVLLAAALAAEGATGERITFVAVAIAANLNLVLFYSLRGEPRIPPSLVRSLDWSAVLAFANVVLVIAYFVVSVLRDRRARSSLAIQKYR